MTIISMIKKVMKFIVKAIGIREADITKGKMEKRYGLFTAKN